MTPISGVEVLRHLHTSPAAEGSILVMLSGIQDFNIIREGYQLGATTFLVKPLQNDDVLQMISAIRGLKVETTSEGYILSSAAVPSVLSPGQSRYLSA